MKNRFMLSTAGAATVAMASTAFADTQLLDFVYDIYAGEAGWTITDGAGSVVGSMYVSNGYIVVAGAVSSTFSSISPEGYAHGVTYDLAAGDYTVLMTDTWGDGWSWNGVAGGVTINGETTLFSTGSSMPAAFTVGGGGSDPCDDALPGPCAEDLDGDGAVAVSDVLIVIGSWGQMGDGTFRPEGDCAPLPNGDCYVDVADVLGVVGAWGADCAPPPVYGSCCMADESCSDLTSDDCAAAGGTYGGDDTDCANTSCVVGAGDSCADPLMAYDGANAFDTTTNSAGADLPTCPDDADAFGWTSPSNDVWLSWTAGASADYNIDTCDANSFDTSMVVYSGCGGALDQLACNGDGADLTGCQTYYSNLTLSATAGTTYLIRIGGWDATEMGPGTLSINEAAPPSPGACCFTNDDCLDNLDSDECALFGGSFAGEGTSCGGGACDAPANDECASAAMAVVGANSFDTSLMTPSTPEPDDTMCTGTFLDWTGSQDAWFEWVADADGLASFSLCDGASYDTSMVLYAGDCDTQVACNGDASGEAGCQAYYSAIYDWPVTAGTSYYIRIGGWQAANGTGTLTIAAAADVPSACCVGTGCELLDIAGCAGAGGVYMGAGSVCEDIACYQGCPAGSEDEGAPCMYDGDDALDDPNCGANCSPATFQALTLGTPMCGTASVYLDISGGTYRDLDWYNNATVDGGGTYTFTVGSSGMDLLFGIIDLNTGAFVDGAAWVLTGGVEATVEAPAIPAGSYSLVAAPADWNTDWTCDSGLVEYFMLVE